MKKLIAFLMIVGLSASVMAAGFPDGGFNGGGFNDGGFNGGGFNDGGFNGGQTKPGSNSGQTKLSNGTYVYDKSYTTSTATASAPLTVTVSGSNGEKGHAYFTTISQEAFDAYNASLVADGKAPMTTVSVQFLGTDIDKSHGSYSSLEGMNLSNISDYGIYLYDKTKQGTAAIGTMYSITKGNSFDIGTGKDFGVYYTDGNKTYYSTENYIGAYDNNTDHKIKVYNADGTSKTIDVPDMRFTCAFMSQQSGAGAWHWEFVLQTTLDNPHYDVDPHDFEGNGNTDIPDTPTTSGQPLPGTLATLLIGGLCASTLRKKNQK